MFTTPTKPTRSHQQLLENTMGRADLANLADLLNKECSDWAFIGSVAMQIHGHDLNSENAKNWLPGDADVLTNDIGAAHLCDKPFFHTGQDGRTESRTRGPTFNFTETLKVDVVKANRTDTRFAGLETDTIMIKGTPVLKIDALIRLKKSALQYAKDDRQPSGVIERIKANLAVLEELKVLSDERKQQATAGHRHASTGLTSDSTVPTFAAQATTQLSARGLPAPPFLDRSKRKRDFAG